MPTATAAVCPARAEEDDTTEKGDAAPLHVVVAVIDEELTGLLHAHGDEPDTFEVEQKQVGCCRPARGCNDSGSPPCTLIL
jgi:hypothetical protein